jgi:hypothetical protein
MEMKYLIKILNFKIMKPITNIFFYKLTMINILTIPLGVWKKGFAEWLGCWIVIENVPGCGCIVDCL